MTDITSILKNSVENTETSVIKIKNGKYKSLLEICIEWNKNKLINPLKPINPITEYSIKKNSAKYNELEKLCMNIKINIDELKKDIIKLKKKSVLTSPLTIELCEKWMANKFKNPITNYNINENSLIYKEFDNECPSLLLNKNINKPIINPNIKHPSIKVIDNTSKKEEKKREDEEYAEEEDEDKV